MPYIPENITRDPDSGLEMATFDYYTGIAYAKENGLKQTDDYLEVRDGRHYIVFGGDVMVAVTHTDYPEIERRLI